MMNGISLFLIGAVFFSTAFWTSLRCVERAGGLNLPRAAALKISVRIVSCIQACLASAVGLYTALACRDVLYDRSVWLETYIYFGESYLIYDLCAMFVAHSDEHGNNLRKFMRLKGSAVVHHILYGSVGFALVTVWRRGLGDFFVGCVFFNDFSTIFLSFAAILELLHMEASVLYPIIGLLLTVSFFLCRIAVFPFMYWMYARYTGQLTVWEVPWTIPWFCSCGCLLVLLLQIYWFSIILSKGVKVLCAKVCHPDKKL